MTAVSKTTVKDYLKAAAYYLLAIVAAFGVAGLILLTMHQDVLLGYKTILTTSFSSLPNFALTIFKFTPIYLMGLGFSIPLASRKFNVGIEGQFLLGAVGAAAVGITLTGMPGYIILPLLLTVALIMGAIWATVPALLLYFFRVNEIISTILMNFISFYLVDLIALGPWRDVTAGYPMTIPISSSARLPIIGSQINIGSLFTIALAVLGFFILYRSTFGYELRASGSNPIAAFKFGIKTSYLAPLSLVLGGAVAGLAGGLEVSGLYFRLVEGMQSNYANLAIIVSLMARGNPVALLLTSFFFSMIEIGANAMQRTMGTPYEIALITESLMMLFVMTVDAIRQKRR
uniref:ABC transporter permease n=1 Tax=Fervidicoccus fontis TaxID=683846 RepID=A0A7J3SMK6_9CREN